MSDESEGRTEVALERIQGMINEAVGEIVTDFVLVANTFTQQGQQATWILYPDSASPTMTLGLLEYARLREASRVMGDEPV